MEPIHLRYDYMEAGLGCGENRHAQEVMKELGIKYQISVPQTIGDQWWFWNCTNLPKKLPSYITILDVDPMGAIGYGLSEKMAIKIRDYKPRKKPSRPMYFTTWFHPMVHQKRLVLRLKHAGIWDKLDVFYDLRVKSPTLYPLEREI